jgi:hypothetical protein
MKRQRLLTTFAAMIAVLVSVSVAGAFDTSPYLAGTWEDDGTIGKNVYAILNPTTKPLHVYMFWYMPDGTVDACMSVAIPSNGTVSFGLGIFSGGPGAVKFFAFPEGSRKFDPNAVIGGFQRKAMIESQYDFFDFSMFDTETNLKAVTINSYTVGEFAQLPWESCLF